VDVELTPEQPAPIADAIEALLVPPPAEADPWWLAGLQESLGA
jgi:hypothetical protein